MSMEDKVKRRYLEIQDELSQIHSDKIRQYGIGMYEEHSAPFRYWAAYFNIRRKTLRLMRLTEAVLSMKDDEAQAKLIDDYKDIANYAIMAIQILEERDEIRSDSNT